MSKMGMTLSELKLLGEEDGVDNSDVDKIIYATRRSSILTV
jgi:hypothetical protein